MQDRLFDPANEWHEYKGCRLLRTQAVFAAKRGFIFVEDSCVREIHLIDDESVCDSAAMVSGYIILSKRTTLAVFRSILPGTTRFFFLSLPLLRFLRERKNPPPAWCIHALHGMQLLIETDIVNKGSAGCTQTMSGYYTGLACLVLFDAKGTVAESGLVYTGLAVCATLLLLSLKFVPAVLYRPQQLVDALCDDILCITAHAACIGMMADPSLRHGCALHSACFVIQHRFLGRMPSMATGTVVHTMLALLLILSYFYGLRITDVQRFMLSAVCPHALELLAQLLTRAHQVAVIAASADTC